MVKRLTAIKRFHRNEKGSMTIFGLFLAIAMICVGGLGIDIAHAVLMRTHLQVAADSAAHAALVARELKTESEAKTIALSVAAYNMPSTKYGNVIQDSDIQFGTWDETNEEFTISPGSDDAVLINTQLIASRNNSMGTYFLKFLGMDSLDVLRQSVFVTYIPTCLREGFVAQDRVDIQSGNLYKEGFCVHSNSHVELNSGNTFEDNVIVSMPDRRDVVLPSSGYTQNTGLSAALRDGSYIIRILERIDGILAGVQDPTSKYYRSYITSSIAVVHDYKDDFDSATNWFEGRIHTATCNGSTKSVTFKADTYKNGVLITNCQVRFIGGAELQNTVIVTTNTNSDSIGGSSNPVFGKDDNCAAGGGVQLVTYGGISFASKIELYGSQMIAAGDISFTSQANGIQGASIIAGGEIDGTTSMVMAFCNGAGMESNFEAEYFRLAA